MAIIWSKQIHDTTYEVRTAGRSVRLYSNGVLHSQHHPENVITGAIWDLLVLPAFFLSEAPNRVLVLGLGGGAVVHAIRYFFPNAHVTCVELDAQHIQIAKRWFKLPVNNVKVVHGDAYEYLRSCEDQFDWVLDDVFQHVSGDPLRPNSLTDTWPLYKAVLKKNALLSFNLIESESIRQVKSVVSDKEMLFQYSHPLYENRIVCVLEKGDLNYKDMARAFKSRINSYKELDQSRKTCRLKYKIQRLQSSNK